MTKLITVSAYDSEWLKEQHLAMFALDQVALVRGYLTNPNHYDNPRPGYTDCQEAGLIVLKTGDRLIVSKEDLAAIQKIWDRS
jgi:hypothetical protein